MINTKNKKGISPESIKEDLSKYGIVYFPEDIREDIDDIVGYSNKKERLEDFFEALNNYEDYKEVLKTSSLNPSLTVLLYGPPGTGKTALTRAFSKKYQIPICVVESDRLVSPLLGDTIKNIRQVIEISANIAEDIGKFILFFDEIDAIGSERSNIHEVGEIKRAVISFLQVIDRVNYEGKPLAIFGATNHQQQLDSAIWRRFTFHLEFDFPNYTLRKKIIESYLEIIKSSNMIIENQLDFIKEELKEEYEIINNKLKYLGYNPSEIEKKSGLEDRKIWEEISKENEKEGLLKLTYGYTGSDIERGTKVALFKAIGRANYLNFEIFKNSLKLVGGTAEHLQQQNGIEPEEKDIKEEGLTLKKEEISKKEFFNEFKKIIEILKEIESFFNSQKEIIEKVGYQSREYITYKNTLNDILENIIENYL